MCVHTDTHTHTHTHTCFEGCLFPRSGQRDQILYFSQNTKAPRPSFPYPPKGNNPVLTLHLVEAGGQSPRGPGGGRVSSATDASNCPGPCHPPPRPRGSPVRTEGQAGPEGEDLGPIPHGRSCCDSLKASGPLSRGSSPELRWEGDTPPTGEGAPHRLVVSGTSISTREPPSHLPLR